MKYKSFESLPISDQPRILGIGVVVIDQVLSIDKYPSPDSKNEATDSWIQVGGPVPTALAHLPFPKHFLSIWGDDAFGTLIEQQLTQDGTGFHQEYRQPIATPVTQVWLESTTGNRTLVTHRPKLETIKDYITLEFLSQFNVLHLDCWPIEAALKAATLMKQQGGLVCLDTGSPKEGVAELLKLADVVNCPRHFCELFCGTESLEEGARKVAEFGPALVTITAGADGAVMFENGITIRLPATHIEHIIDTNGAGDVFCAGLINGVLKRERPAKILERAVQFAGRKCAHRGNRFC